MLPESRSTLRCSPLTPCSTPNFRLPVAAVERRACEVYLAAAKAPERLPPADALSGVELYKLHSLLTGADAASIARGPGRALLAGLRVLGISWPLPHALQFSGRENQWDLTFQPPAPLRMTAKRMWEESRRAAAKEAIQARWTRMAANEEIPLSEVIGAEPDIEFILDSLRHSQLPVAAVKASGAVVWGVLPTADWLSRHGWRNPGVCPWREEADDAAHALDGCVDSAPEAHRIARGE